VTVSPEKTLSAPGTTWIKYWYRIPVPATSVAVTLPRFRKPYHAFYNGAPLAVDGDGRAQFPAPAEGAENVLAIEMAANDEVRSSPVFTLESAKTRLGSWLDTGLPYFSGTAVYETEVEIPAAYAGRQLTLDCGEVGVVAEVRVNGQAAGVRVWLPFAFDISKLVKPGKNRIEIAVTNTMENERAVDNRAARLQRLKHSGLIGPVKVMAGGPR
jgi:hypothetical protein